ncbi:hypothetical protein [Candidatus Pantoea persica]|uniref:hypothetical protein n=1 Tax=Candidatus Pantoea persica TaxID=2518128 RepID=UPI00215D9F87|nr:hypothetical protein [Candidatus Pantoea persica]
MFNAVEELDFKEQLRIYLNQLTERRRQVILRQQIKRKVKVFSAQQIAPALTAFVLALTAEFHQTMAVIFGVAEQLRLFAASRRARLFTSQRSLRQLRITLAFFVVGTSGSRAVSQR